MFEKEAKEYQEEVISKKDYPHSIALDWQRGAEFGYSKATDEGTSWAHLKSLEKENAELREKAAEHKKTSIFRGWSTLCYKEKYDKCLRENTGLKIHNAYVEKKLTKAKEIIKKLSDAYKYVIRFEEYADKKVLAEAEQFLEEKENDSSRTS